MIINEKSVFIYCFTLTKVLCLPKTNSLNIAKQSKIADMDTIKLLEKRLKHQKSEVAEAKKNLGKDGFTKSYLNRMAGNVKQTEFLLRKYKKSK